MALARGQVIGFADADYKTPIEELAKLLPWLEKGYDIVIGSRNVTESAIEHAQPLYRRLGSRGFGICMHLLVGLWGIHDTQCGFKFFQGEVARDLFGASASMATCLTLKSFTWRCARLPSQGSRRPLAR